MIFFSFLFKFDFKLLQFPSTKVILQAAPIHRLMRGLGTVQGISKFLKLNELGPEPFWVSQREKLDQKTKIDYAECFYVPQSS